VVSLLHWTGPVKKMSANMEDLLFFINM